MVISMDWDVISGMMHGSTLDSGPTTKCLGLGVAYGKTVASTRASG